MRVTSADPFRPALSRRVFMCGVAMMLILPLCSCGQEESEHEDSLTICVASSLNDAVSLIAADIESHTGQRSRISAAASGTLKKQIEQGAPCDVFISADPALMQALCAQELVKSDSVRVVARNALVVGMPVETQASDSSRDPAARDGVGATHAESAAPPSDPADVLLDSAVDRIAIANPDYAPAGRYARQALEACGLWSRVFPKLVMADDASSAANLVQRGFVDAGIFYESDRVARDGMVIAHRFAPHTHDPIEYVAGIVSDHPGARSWLQLVTSDSNQATWRRLGFQPPARKTTGSTRSTSQPTVHESNRPSVVGPILLSLRVSLLALGVMLVPCLFMALWLARTQSKIRVVVEAVLVMPLVVPPVVTGFLLLVILRALPVALPFTWWAAGIASATVSFPLLVRTARAAIEQIDPRLENVARTLGSSQWRVWRTVTLPLAWRGIVGGAVLAWARAFGEFGATIVVAGNMPGSTRTVPLAIWTGVQSASDSAVAPLVGSAIAISFVAVALSEWLVRRPRTGAPPGRA